MKVLFLISILFIALASASSSAKAEYYEESMSIMNAPLYRKLAAEVLRAKLISDDEPGMRS